MLNKDFIGVGVAGNFAGHLEQAGEARDFAHLEASEQAPKGIFPFYVPHHRSFLAKNPFSAGAIQHPGEDYNLQIEPELAIVCKIKYTDSKKVKSLEVRQARAFNDCSQRRPDAKKISEKKNWGPASKGLADQFIAITDLNDLKNCRIASYLLRDSKLHKYGIDSKIADYSYFGEKLLTWLADRLNNQQDSGPLENIHRLLSSAFYPDQICVAVGATRYTEFGEKNFLKPGDESIVVIYDEQKFTATDVEGLLLNPGNAPEALKQNGAISILRQLVKA